MNSSTRGPQKSGTPCGTPPSTGTSSRRPHRLLPLAQARVARTAANATARIRFYTAAGNPADAADAAYAASDALHTAAAALGSRTLRQAADAFDRAARQPYGRIPSPTPAGNQLRHAARLISAYAYLTGDPALTPVVLLVRLAALAEAVAELRDSQQRAAQAAAALRAARHIRTAARPAPPTRPPGRPATATTPSASKSAQPRSGTATGLAQLSFPAAPRPRPPATEHPGPGSGDPPRYAGNHHLGHAAPPAKPGRPGITLHWP